MTHTPTPSVFGNVDLYEQDSYLGGWVFDREHPISHDAPIYLRIDGKVISKTYANLHRGDGYHGFRLYFQYPSFTSLLLQGRAAVSTFDRKDDEVILNIHKPLLISLQKDQEVPVGLQTSVVSSEELTEVNIAVGTSSLDLSAIFGRNGYIFLNKGSNDVHSLYSRDPNSVEVKGTVHSWLNIFRQRSQFLKNGNITYIQIIIPEKSSAMPAYAPLGLGPITPTLQSIEQCIIDDIKLFKTRESGFYKSVTDLLRSADRGGASAFLKTDSHLSVAGAQLIIEMILDFLADTKFSSSEQIDLARRDLNAISKSKMPGVFSGDLAGRFFHVPVFEIAQDLHVKYGKFENANITTNVVRAAADGHHIGTYYWWRNDDAPLKIRILAFGNSFFERGSAPRGLSWWCKNLFAEFHFVWSPEVDAECVEKIRPDVVICQTIERFLHVIPQH